MNQNKSIYAVLILVLLAGIAIAGYYFYSLKPIPVVSPTLLETVTANYVTTLRGNAKKIEENKIFIDFVSVEPSKFTENIKNTPNLSFLTNASTTWERRELTLPSYESLRASGKTTRRIEGSDLMKKESTGSMADLKSTLTTSAVFIQADFAEPADATSTELTAAKVSYQIIKVAP